MTELFEFAMLLILINFELRKVGTGVGTEPLHGSIVADLVKAPSKRSTVGQLCLDTVMAWHYRW